MAETMEEEEIVEGNEELGGRKRANDDEDARPAKRVQSEGNEAAGCGNLGGGEEEERQKEQVDRLRGLLEDNPEKMRNKNVVEDFLRSLDVDEITSLGLKSEQRNGSEQCWVAEVQKWTEDKEEEVGEGQKEKVDRLRGLLEDNPKKLRNKDVEDVIRYLHVDEITSLALKSEERNGSEQCWVAEVEKWKEDEGVSEEVIDAVRSMLCFIEGAKRAKFRLLYEKLAPKAFAKLLLAAVDAYSIRQLGGHEPLLKAEEHDVIPKLCCVLPWKLIAHIIRQKIWPTLLNEETDDEEEEEECTAVQKEAAKNSDICFGKGRHTGSYGSCCTFKDAIPEGTTVGTDNWITCADSGFSEFTDSFEGCVDCDWEDDASLPFAP